MVARAAGLSALEDSAGRATCQAGTILRYELVSYPSLLQAPSFSARTFCTVTAVCGWSLEDHHEDDEQEETCCPHGNRSRVLLDLISLDEKFGNRGEQ